MRCTEPQPALPRPTGEPAAQALEQLLAQSLGNISEAACQLGVRHAQWRGP